MAPGPRRDPDEERPLDVRLVRPEDLMDLRLTAVGCTLEDGAAGQLLVGHGDDASLVLHLPPQHLGERAWWEGGPAGAVSAHRAAAPSRVVFALADGQAVPFTLDGVLTVLPTLALRVSSHAAPASTGLVRPWWPGGVLVDDWADQLAGGAATADLLVGGGVRLARQSDAAARVLTHARAARVLRGWAPPPDVTAGLPAGGVPSIAPGLRGVLGGFARPGGLIDPGVVGPVVRDRPRPPREDETSLEVPYRVTVSPSVRGAFTHAVDPVRAVDDAGRTELWRTHLTVRTTGEDGAFTGHDPSDDTQRIVRAIWSRDMDPQDATATTDPAPLAPQSLAPAHRRALVRQTADPRVRARRPLQVRSLALSSLGAWVDWQAAWDTVAIGAPQGTGNTVQLLESYRHQAVMGRDSYVRVTIPGFLYPFGHRAVWVQVTERKVRDRSQGVAYLWQRFFIIVREPTRTYDGHDTPLTRVTLEPLVTPDLDPAPDGDAGGPFSPFVPQRGGAPFEFSLVTADQGGGAATYSAGLLFVPQLWLEATDDATAAGQAESLYGPVRRIDARGQQVTVARPVVAGDTTLDVDELRFSGELQRATLSSRPYLSRMRAVVPSMRHLAPAAPAVDLVYPPHFLAADDAGFGAANPGEVFLALAGAPPVVDFSGGSDSSGGFLAPNLSVKALSRAFGAVGDDGAQPQGLSQGQFDPATFLAGALPKLFGLFSLVDILDALGFDGVPDFVTEALDTVSAIVTEAQRLRDAAAGVDQRFVDEIAGAAHDGATAGLEAARAQLATAVGPLLGHLDALTAAVAALPGAADPVAAVGDVTDALGDVVTDIDALLGAVGAPQLPSHLRAALERPAKALRTLASAAETVQALADMVQDLLSPSTSVTARFEWAPKIVGWPAGAEVFVPHVERGLRLAVEVRASATTPPAADVSAEIVDFSLVLLPGEPLMGMRFQRIGFRAGSSAKPVVDVVFGGIEFLGPLAFIDTLRRMIPFDGFADPPYVDVSPEGVTAGFDLALPNVSVGVFSLENISLGADARVPFLGDAVTVGFFFCTKESPFRLTVMMIGGGGWVGLRASPKGLVLLEMGLEATACLSIDLGVASGSVSIAVGVYLRLEADKGSLTGYFRIRGEVDVLGLISASITLELSLTYHFDSGKLIGRASLVIEVEVLFFSASVEVTCERQLAGSKGDPVLADVMPPVGGANPDWSRYCEAFAAVA